MVEGSRGISVDAGGHISGNAIVRLMILPKMWCCNAKSILLGLLQIQYESQGIKLCNLRVFDKFLVNFYLVW